MDAAENCAELLLPALRGLTEVSALDAGRTARNLVKSACDNGNNKGARSSKIVQHETWAGGSTYVRGGKHAEISSFIYPAEVNSNDQTSEQSVRPRPLLLLLLHLLLFAHNHQPYA